jgi:hypothetical protein
MADPVNTVLPAITGTALVGETLACSSGTWTNSPTAYSYQWQRETGAGTGIYADIGGASGQTWIAVTADVGRRLDCVVTATNVAPNLPPFTPVRTVTVTNQAGLLTAIANLQAGDLVNVTGTFTGQIQFSKILSGFAVFDLTNAIFAGSNTAFVGMWFYNSRYIRTVGGEFKNPGGDGIRVEWSSNIEIYDPIVHNTGSQGILVQGNGGPNTGIKLVRPEVYACGDITKDPHVNFPGTGLHCIYWGGATQPSSGEIIDAHCHDQLFGCGIELGAHATSTTVTNPLIERITGAHYGTAGGNAFNIWGGSNSGVLIDGATGNNITGNVCLTDSLSSPAGSVVAQNCTFTVVGRSPAYMPATGITYINCV